MKTTIISFIFVSTASLFLQANSKQELTELKKQYLRPKSIPYLDGNKYSSEKEILGKKLFFDPRLSGSGVMSCATCHNPSLGWSDGLTKGIGHGHMALGRRTPTILNLAWTDKMMWDGRFSQLEEQATGPIGSEAEMNMSLKDLPERIKKIQGYRDLFAKAFPHEEITTQTIAKAIAIYERGVVSGQAPFDKWILGNEKAITDEAKKGFLVFNQKANCAACHSGWRFTDDSFQDIGLKSEDIGRGKYLKLKSQQFAFKTPGLRNIAERAPYMHDGSETDLDGVIEFYNRGGDMKRESLSSQIKPLELTPEEKNQLKAFLASLTSKDKPVNLPILPK
jgi:cytochrome c peroxidase